MRDDMNIFERENINWENFTSWILWHEVVYHGNEYSGYDIMVRPLEQMGGYKKGDIVSDVRFMSYYVGDTRPLTWKELTLALGFWKDILLPDGHKCEECPGEKDCKATFKYDKEQERCSGWMKDCPDKVLDLDEEYDKFIKNLIDGPDKLRLLDEKGNITNVTVTKDVLIKLIKEKETD